MFQTTVLVTVVAAGVAVSGSAAEANGCEGDASTCVGSKPPATTTTTTPVAPTTTTVAPTTTTVPVTISVTQTRRRPATPVTAAPTTTTVAPVPAVEVLGIITECQSGTIDVPVRNTGTAVGEVAASMRGESTATTVAPGTTEVMHLDLGPRDLNSTKVVTVSGDAAGRQRVGVECGDVTGTASEDCPWFTIQGFLLGLLTGLLLAFALWLLTKSRNDDEDLAEGDDDAGSDPAGV